MIIRTLSALLLLAMMVSFVNAAPLVRGTYLEARTCQIYTGPCFAAGEVDSGGRQAVMSWRITSGEYQGVDLSGRSVAIVVKSSDTLGFNGLDDARSLSAVMYLDSAATADQQAALRAFAIQESKIDAERIVKSERVPIQMDFDLVEITGKLQIADRVTLDARKARPGDCICSNESAYYPPLVRLAGSAPGVARELDVASRPLGTRWSLPGSRSAYLGRFEVDPTNAEIQNQLVDR